MKNNENLSEKYACLRRQAEDRIKQWPNSVSSAPGDAQKVIHELKIHLAELEIQNEDLMRALHQATARQEADANIYESGPPDNKTAQFLKDYHRVMDHRDEAAKRAKGGEKQ